MFSSYKNSLNVSQVHTKCVRLRIRYWLNSDREVHSQRNKDYQIEIEQIERKGANKRFGEGKEALSPFRRLDKNI